MKADVSIRPLPSAFATVTLPARTASIKPPLPRTNRTGVRWIAEAIVDAPEDDVHRLQSIERLEKHVIVSDG